MVGDLDDVAGEAYPLVNMDEIGLQTLEEGIDHPLDDRIPGSGVVIEEDVIPVQPVHFETVHIVLLETGLLPRDLAAGQQTDLQPRPLLSAAQILHIGFHPPRAFGRELMNDVKDLHAAGWQIPQVEAASNRSSATSSWMVTGSR